MQRGYIIRNGFLNIHLTRNTGLKKKKQEKLKKGAMFYHRIISCYSVPCFESLQ